MTIASIYVADLGFSLSVYRNYEGRIMGNFQAAMPWLLSATVLVEHPRVGTYVAIVTPWGRVMVEGFLLMLQKSDRGTPPVYTTLWKKRLIRWRTTVVEL